MAFVASGDGKMSVKFGADVLSDPKSRTITASVVPTPPLVVVL